MLMLMHRILVVGIEITNVVYAISQRMLCKRRKNEKKSIHIATPTRKFRRIEWNEIWDIHWVWNVIFFSLSSLFYEISMKRLFWFIARRYLSRTQAKLLQITDVYEDDLIGIPIKTFFSIHIHRAMCLNSYIYNTHLFFRFFSFLFYSLSLFAFHFPFSDFTYTE